MSTLTNTFDNRALRAVPPFWYPGLIGKGMLAGRSKEGEAAIEPHRRHPSITLLLQRWNDGDRSAADELVPLVHEELMRLAKRRMKGQPRGHTLEATALVNEAFLKLFGEGQYDWRDREHFLRAASRAMRSILVDHARGKNRVKRKPTGDRVFLDELVASYEDRAQDIVALDESLKRLEEIDPDLVRVVELRFYCGCTVDETARALGFSTRKTERAWTAARAWLRSQLE